MARGYTPRRFGARWNEGAPAYILDVLDNKGKTADRYTVMYCKDQCYHMAKDGTIKPGPGEFHNTYIPYMAMSENPTHPQGVGMSGELKAHEAANYRYSAGKDRIKWNDLPEKVKACAIRFATQSD
jgi:hypothetical protein